MKGKIGAQGVTGIDGNAATQFQCQYLCVASKKAFASHISSEYSFPLTIMSLDDGIIEEGKNRTEEEEITLYDDLGDIKMSNRNETEQD